MWSRCCLLRAGRAPARARRSSKGAARADATSRSRRVGSWRRRSVRVSWCGVSLRNGSLTMPVVVHKDVPFDPFNPGATYQTLVGDAQGSTPFRLGIQTSSPGYRTPLHSHPYMESLTVLEGEG